MHFAIAIIGTIAFLAIKITVSAHAVLPHVKPLNTEGCGVQKFSQRTLCTPVDIFQVLYSAFIFLRDNRAFLSLPAFCTQPVEKPGCSSGLPLNWHGIKDR